MAGLLPGRPAAPGWITPTNSQSTGRLSARNIAVFCDGTWNNRDRTENDTSVARLEEVVQEAQGQQGRAEQRTWYQAGVGANDGLKGIWKLLDKFRGGALGRGLTADIRECYQFLVDTYRPGDKLFIFGFSRGAYTARSLAGLIRSAGIVSHSDDIDAAMAWYRNRAAITHPSSPQSHMFRARVAPLYYTSAEEREWRCANGMAPGTALGIDYLGVFDTVGAHGVPGVLGQFRAVSGGHGFHDHQLSRSVYAGRHAVAIDETRILYSPTLWANLAHLNTLKGQSASGANPYQQLWFPGAHGKLGGSGAERALSKAVLAWIVQGAIEAGLPIDLPESLQPEPDAHLGPLHNTSKGFDPTGLLRWVRNGPAIGAIDDLHETTLARIKDRPDYRPGALRKLLLDGQSLREIQDRAPTHRP